MAANRVAKAAQKAGVEYHKKVTENKKAIKDGLPLPHLQIQELADPALWDPALKVVGLDLKMRTIIMFLALMRCSGVLFSTLCYVANRNANTSYTRYHAHICSPMHGFLSRIQYAIDSA